MKILSIVIICLLIVSFLYLGYTFISNKAQPVKPTNTGIYYGPVQPGYNETLFRKTGKYEKEINTDGS